MSFEVVISLVALAVIYLILPYIPKSKNKNSELDKFIQSRVEKEEVVFEGFYTNNIEQSFHNYERCKFILFSNKLEVIDYFAKPPKVEVFEKNNTSTFLETDQNMNPIALMNLYYFEKSYMCIKLINEKENVFILSKNRQLLSRVYLMFGGNECFL